MDREAWRATVHGVYKKSEMEKKKEKKKSEMPEHTAHSTGIKWNITYKEEKAQCPTYNVFNTQSLLFFLSLSSFPNLVNKQGKYIPPIQRSWEGPQERVIPKIVGPQLSSYTIPFRLLSTSLPSWWVWGDGRAGRYPFPDKTVPSLVSRWPLPSPTYTELPVSLNTS